MILQGVFEQWGQNWQDFVETADPVRIWGIVLLTLAIVCFALLVFFTEYKRPGRESVKFTAIILVLFSLFAGFGLHMILIASPP